MNTFLAAAPGWHICSFISCQPWSQCWFSRNVPDCKISGLLKLQSVEEPGGMWAGGGTTLSDSSWGKCCFGGAWGRWPCCLSVRRPWALSPEAVLPSLPGDSASQDAPSLLHLSRTLTVSPRSPCFFPLTYLPGQWLVFCPSA